MAKRRKLQDGDIVYDMRHNTVVKIRQIIAMGDRCHKENRLIIIEHLDGGIGCTSGYRWFRYLTKKEELRLKLAPGSFSRDEEIS